MSTAVPLSMAPIAFGLAALPLSSGINGGAAMMTAMSVAAMVGATPLAALGRRYPPDTVLRALVAGRAVTLVLLTAAVATTAPLALLVALAALAGLGSGAIYGFLRAALNDLIEAGRLPRALGIAATANELVFVVGPVIASVVGAFSVPVAIAVMAAAGALPLVLLPRRRGNTPAPGRVRTRGVSRQMLIWLFCAACCSAVVAAVEVGSVALAVRHGLAPHLALLFTVPLCIASVTGGVWVSVRNKKLRRRTVVLLLACTLLGGLSTIGSALWLPIVGTVLVGLCLAPLGTFYSLVLDEFLPADRRAEGFALLRTSKSLGLITASTLLTLTPVHVTLAVATGLVLAALCLVLVVHVPAYRQRSRT